MIDDSPVDGISYRQRRPYRFSRQTSPEDQQSYCPVRGRVIKNVTMHQPTMATTTMPTSSPLHKNLHNTFSPAGTVTSILLKHNKKSSNPTNNIVVNGNNNRFDYSLFSYPFLSALLHASGVLVRNNANESTKGTCKINFIPKRSPIPAEGRIIAQGIFDLPCVSIVTDHHGSWHAPFVKMKRKLLDVDRHYCGWFVAVAANIDCSSAHTYVAVGGKTFHR